MNKFQVIIKFVMDDEFMLLVHEHRTYINFLINKGVVDSYAVSMESQMCWITMNTETKAEAAKYISKAPLFKYWEVKIEELFVFDTQRYRLPALQLN